MKRLPDCVPTMAAEVAVRRLRCSAASVQVRPAGSCPACGLPHPSGLPRHLNERLLQRLPRHLRTQPRGSSPETVVAEGQESTILPGAAVVAVRALQQRRPDGDPACCLRSDGGELDHVPLDNRDLALQRLHIVQALGAMKLERVVELGQFLLVPRHAHLCVKNPSSGGGGLRGVVGDVAAGARHHLLRLLLGVRALHALVVQLQL
mmetsp:Transcript_18537/g.51099  ORF Transcript_18537/g.51099 Transcript_18537/m.51099 type:complete len:206 (+) Transcript_18537:1805-2422(+)